MKSLAFSFFFLLTTLLGIINVSADPVEVYTDGRSFPVITATFEPAPFNSVIGDLEIEAFYLFEGVPAPSEGIFVSRDAFGKIEFIIEQQEEWCQERIDSQKNVCQSLIHDCHEDCKSLNKEIRKNFDDITIVNENLNLKLKDIEQFNFYLKIALPVSFIAGVGMTYFILK